MGSCGDESAIEKSKDALKNEVERKGGYILEQKLGQRHNLQGAHFRLNRPSVECQLQCMRSYFC